MAGSPALLLLLSLGLCCTTAQGQSNTLEARFLNRNMKHPQEGQRLELECLNYERNRPIFWIRLDKGGNLHFILSSTQSYPSTLQEAVKTAPNFEALRRGNSYRLVVKSFRTQDEGTYFCIQYINQVLHFSSGQRAFFPGATTAATTTHTATTQSSQLTKKDSSQQGSNAAEHITPTATTQSSQVTTKDNSQQGPHAGTRNKDTPRFYCKMVMWVNLAVTCLLLLTAITITITHCQKIRCSHANRGSISSAEINTATRHTRSPPAHHLQDQAQRKQAVLRRCSAQGTQASSSSTALIPAAAHTAALMQRRHLAAPPLLPTSTAHLPRPDMCSCPTLLGHTQTAPDTADPNKPGSSVPLCKRHPMLPRDDQEIKHIPKL
ncbi:T-cell surface glycoprotein CD8 alpha chain-like [Phasianus colchicus]|uniref:T-cell surface glycoprotein CD8 alpha chain-like n=1 Tax=Phasianus colchicus TaxID=9054 RepID=UPI00129EF387|nr:T-cell surface glycoprotein CD8 alpha chain-like [Phasianus colchicus]